MRHDSILLGKRQRIVDLRLGKEREHEFRFGCVEFILPLWLSKKRYQQGFWICELGTYRNSLRWYINLESSIARVNWDKGLLLRVEELLQLMYEVEERVLWNVRTATSEIRLSSKKCLHRNQEVKVFKQCIIKIVRSYSEIMSKTEINTLGT